MKTIKSNYVTPSDVALPHWQLLNLNCDFAVRGTITASYGGFVSVAAANDKKQPVERKVITVKVVDVDFSKDVFDQVTALFAKDKFFGEAADKNKLV